MAEILHHLLHEVVTYAVIGFEWIGVIIIAISGIRGVIELFKKNPDIDLHLSQGMAVALQFMLCAEIVKLITIGDLTDILLVLGIVVLHIAITLLVAYELNHKKHERHERHERHEKKKHEQELQAQQLAAQQLQAEQSKAAESPAE
ncbi:hypothetical protein [Frisingicoccus sp.]|uniref:hypothetical protein n=1 Tax=Frisingicoccus sp. TaxID=1918627 RepID=UPI003AB2B15E